MCLYGIYDHTQVCSHISVMPSSCCCLPSVNDYTWLTMTVWVGFNALMHCTYCAYLALQRQLTEGSIRVFRWISRNHVSAKKMIFHLEIVFNTLNSRTVYHQVICNILTEFWILSIKFYSVSLLTRHDWALNICIVLRLPNAKCSFSCDTELGACWFPPQLPFCACKCPVIFSGSLKRGLLEVSGIDTLREEKYAHWIISEFLSRLTVACFYVKT